MLRALYFKPMPSKQSDIHRRRIEKDIRVQSSRTDAIIPKQSFNRLVHEILADSCAEGLNVRAEAVQALQCAAEDYVTEAFSRASDVACYSNRDTVSDHDLRFALGATAVGRGKSAALPQPRVQPEPTAEASSC